MPLRLGLESFVPGRMHCFELRTNGYCGEDQGNYSLTQGDPPVGAALFS